MALTLSLVTTDPGTVNMWVAKGVTDATAAAAQNVYCGFTPRRVEILNITDQLTDLFTKDMTAATTRHCLAAGTWTDGVANGVTLLTGSEIPPASTLIALGTNGTGGQGFTIGTGPLVASKTYAITVWK